MEVLLSVLALKPSDGLARFLTWLPAQDPHEACRALQGAQ